jgi:hypothetical protein
MLVIVLIVFSVFIGALTVFIIKSKTKEEYLRGREYLDRRNKNESRKGLYVKIANLEVENIDVKDESLTLEVATGTRLIIEELPNGDGISIVMENSVCNLGLVVERKHDNILRVIDADPEQWDDRKL